MFLDPRTKLSILAVTGISVFLNDSVLIELLFTMIPFLLLMRAHRFRLALKSVMIFVLLLAVQMLIVPRLPVTAGGIVYMFVMYIRKLLPCFMLGSFLIRTTKVSIFSSDQSITSAERLYNRPDNYFALFSYYDGRMETNQRCYVVARHIDLIYRHAFTSY